MTTPQTDLQLGDRVQDSITGFAGTVTGIVHYLGGAMRCRVEAFSPSREPGEGPDDGIWFDAGRLLRRAEGPAA